MTMITKTGQQAVSNARLIQKTQFEVAQGTAKTRTAVQPVQVKQIRTPASSQNVIIKTNGQLRSFKVTPKGAQLLISTPKGVPVGTLPNTPASLNALKLGGAAALGTGQAVTGTTAVGTTAAGSAGGFLTLGTLATLGLSLLAGGVAFFAGMGSANSEEPDVRKMEADKAARLKKEKDQKADRPQFKPKFKPLRPLERTKFIPSFMPPIAPAPFKPAAKPALPLKSPPMPYKLVPTVPALPQILPVPKGGKLKSPLIKGLKLAPLPINYVGARGDVEADKPDGKKAKGQIKASGSESVNSRKNEGQVRSERLKSTPLEERYGSKWMSYYAVYYEWCERHNIEPNENADPLNPDNSRSVGFHSINGVTMYQYAPGQYHNASIFDNYLNGTLQRNLSAPAPAESIANQPVQAKPSSKNTKKRVLKTASVDTAPTNAPEVKKTRHGWHVFHRNQYYMNPIRKLMVN